MLILMIELELKSKSEVKSLIDISIEISQQLSNFINYLDRNRTKG